MSFLSNRWLTWAASLVVGGFFIYSSYHKILDPPDFAKAVYNFCLVPDELLHLPAIYLPWFELVAGLAVAIGLGRRGGAFGLGFLTFIFIVVLGFNLYRGHPTICGCFSKFEDGTSWTDEIKFAKMWKELFLDVGLLLLCLQILWGSAMPRAEPEEP